MVIHRGVYDQFSSPVINWAQGRLFTGLNPQKFESWAKQRPREYLQKFGEESKIGGVTRNRGGQTGTNGPSVDNGGLFTDAKTGKDSTQ